MRIWMLAAGAAALAITTPTMAERGGQGGGKGQSAEKVQRGGGQTKAARGGNRALKTENPGTDRAFRFAQRENRGRVREEVRALRAERIDKVRERGRFAEGDRVFRARDIDRGVVRFRDVDRDALFARRIGWVDGCPPGLAKKPVRCMPPGQAAKLVGSPLASVARIAALDPLPRAFRPLFWDDDDHFWRYGGGYLYRVDRDDQLIASMIPLFGAALLGQPLTSNFVNPYYTPSYFNAFYPNSPYDCYRYGYGYVYETDCVTGLVEDVIPTYDYGYGVGQLLPASYGYYNLPYAYRSYYIDDDDYYYRYAPGAIYRVDRDTALISAVAALLTGGLSVGQPLPLGYSAYNVPLAYRTTYFDTPDMWYRYNNGYIYSVDPTTQLVTAIVRALV